MTHTTNSHDKIGKAILSFTKFVIAFNATVLIATGCTVPLPGASALTSAPGNLFVVTSKQGNLSIPNTKTILMSRSVENNFDLLKANAPEKSERGHVSELRLNLFDDVVLNAVLDRVDPGSGNSFIWIGHIQNVQNSQVTLAVEGQVMQGNIALPDTVYQVQYAGNNVHMISKINQAGFPPD